MKESSNEWECWSCRSDAEAAQRCADLMALLLQERLDTQTTATLFVSGGKSPVSVFERLATADIDWRRVDIHLVDERFAPDTPAEQNATLVRRHLLQQGAAHGRFHELLTANSPDDCVQAANARTAAIHQPDIVMLGMGLDGHTASLFPDAAEFEHAMQTPDHYVAVHPRNAPFTRISMTHLWLSQARALMLFIPGPDKWKAFQHFAIHQREISPLQPLLSTLGASATVICTGGES